MEFKERLDHLKVNVDKYIHHYLDEMETTMGRPGLKTLAQSMDYSTREGGQRIRPILALLVGEALGKSGDEIMPYCAALELIHTYSLIHDDLPCMDDDDFRRGKPANHRVFGEAIAVLSGDALCTEAFFLLANKYSSDARLAVDLISELSISAGPRGMVGGQAADVFFKEKSLDQPEVEFLHLYKTGALFRASILGAARICGANPFELKCLSDYARSFGLVFQIADDLVDDAKEGEPSYVKMAGIDLSRKTCLQLIEQAQQALEPLGDKAQGLKKLVVYLYERTLN